MRRYTDPAPEEEGLSCAELVERGAQHLLTNDLVAAVAAHTVWRLLHRRPLTSALTYLDCDTLTVRSVPLTREGVLAQLEAAQ